MFEGAHLHPLLNHAPIFGSLFALGLFIASFFTSANVLRRLALMILIGTAVAGLLADKTGDAAEDAIRGYPGVRREIIHDHEEMADKALILGGVLGALALGALVKWKSKPVPNGVTMVMIVATAFVGGAMIYTGLLGGRVRHTEIRPGAVKADAIAIEPPRQRPPGAPEGN